LQYEHGCGQDQAQARLSDAIRQTGLCSTGIVLSGLRVGNVKISLLRVGGGLDHLWNDRGVSTVFQDAHQSLKVLNISAFSPFFGLRDEIEDGGRKFVRHKLKISDYSVKGKVRFSFFFTLLSNCRAGTGICPMVNEVGIQIQILLQI
jgi:hypothetical protein